MGNAVLKYVIKNRRLIQIISFKKEKYMLLGCEDVWYEKSGITKSLTSLH